MLNCWCITWPVGFKRLTVKNPSFAHKTHCVFLWISEKLPIVSAHESNSLVIIIQREKHCGYCAVRPESLNVIQADFIFIKRYIVIWKYVKNFWSNSPHWGRAPYSLSFYTTHDDPSQSVWLLWRSDQLVAQTCTWQHRTLIANIHVPGGIQTHHLSRRAAADLRLKPRGQLGSQCVNTKHKHQFFTCFGS